jgi:hypothetical protein
MESIMLTLPIVLTILVILALLIIKHLNSTAVYQVLNPDNVWVAEVNTASEAQALRKRGYQVFRQYQRFDGYNYFKKI